MKIDSLKVFRKSQHGVLVTPAFHQFILIKTNEQLDSSGFQSEILIKETVKEVNLAVASCKGTNSKEISQNKKKTHK